MLMPGSALGIGPETEGIRCKMFPPATHMLAAGRILEYQCCECGGYSDQLPSPLAPCLRVSSDD